MTSILHTSVVIDPPPPTFDDEVAVSIITFSELHYGVMVAADQNTRGARLRLLSMLQSQFEPLPVDDAVAAAYGRLAAALAGTDRQRPARVTDLLIAATAVAHEARLVTRDASDFTGLEDLVDIVSI